PPGPKSSEPQMSMLRFLGRRLARHLAKPRPGRSRLPTSHPRRLAATLRAGAVLLDEGSSRFSSAIKYLTQSTWSHAALCVGEALGGHADGAEPHVLAGVAVVEGVRTIPLSAFSGMHTRICRPVGLNPAEIETLVQHLLSRLGYSYDLKNILDLARYLVRSPPVPDDMRRRMIALGSGEPTRAICSTLIAEAFGVIRYPILPDIEQIETTPGPKGAAEVRRAREEILHIRHHSLYVPRDF